MICGKHFDVNNDDYAMEHSDKYLYSSITYSCTGISLACRILRSLRYVLTNKFFPNSCEQVNDAPSEEVLLG